MTYLLTGGSFSSQKPGYAQAVSQIGGTSETAYPYLQYPDVERFDVLILCGGVDVEPIRFGKTLLENNSEQLDILRDKLEFRLFADFVKQSKPIYGICRGMQIINVALGGTIIQDIPSQIQNSISHSTGTAEPIWHEVVTVNGEKILVNSFHHQAVDKLGAGLKPFAKTQDGLTEAFVHEKLAIAAVQWHPEKTSDGLAVLQYLQSQIK